jgi:AraC-like DNA-binding protein
MFCPNPTESISCRSMLRRQAIDIAEVAERVGYGTAFRRHVGQPPGRYAKATA